MAGLSSESRMYLLELARSVISSKARGHPTYDDKVPEDVKRKAGTFVTLTKTGELRGCIGSLEARQEIYRDVVENAEHAAYDDPRFSPLDDAELQDVRIEISVLSAPEELVVNNSQELIRKLELEKPGVILQKGWAKATFLPQVWEELPDGEDFLTHLCMKAGLSPDSWSDPGSLEIFVYRVEHFAEEER